MTTLGGAPLSGRLTERVTARLMAWADALPRQRRERVQDGALAIALALVNVASLLPYHAQIHPFWLALFLVSAQCVPLAWRRSWPMSMAFALAVPRVAYDLLNFGFAPLPLAPAIGLATVMERCGPVQRWVTVIVTAVLVALSQSEPGHTEPYDAIVIVLTLAAAWAVGTLSRARRDALAAESDRASRAEAKAEALAESAAQAAAAERLRIARELHDVVAHHVSLMAVQAEAAGSLLPDRPAEAARSVDLIGQTARQAMTELRRLLGVLREPGTANPAALPAERLVLTPAASLARVDEVLDHVRSAGLPVSYKAWGMPVPLSPSVDLTAYRIVQEALTNTMRHAPGAATLVEIVYEEEYLTVRVTDSGATGGTTGRAGGEAGGRASPIASQRSRSLTPAAMSAIKGGFGLAGIAERVSSCGGTLTVGPREAGGFAIVARLPVR
ncbi:MAG TPA: histidine kinase [Trebonia sp.]